MDRSVFYGVLRKGPLFSGGLNQFQVDGTEALLNEMDRHRLDLWEASTILANVYHETGGYMYPIKETVFPSHKDKNPSDAEVIRRLDAAYAKGKLPWVKAPYWRDGWFGRGQIQLTLEPNYKKMSAVVGFDLVKQRDRALEPEVSARVAVVGMIEGMFTGKGLRDYSFPEDLSNGWRSNPRRIVNGNDGTDAKVKEHAYDFHRAMQTATPINITPTPPNPPVRTRLDILSDMQMLLDELKTLGE